MAEDKGNKGDGTKSAELLAIEKQAQSPEALEADMRRFRENARLIPNTFGGPIDPATQQMLDRIVKEADKFTCPLCGSHSYHTYVFRANLIGAGIRIIDLFSCKGCSTAFLDLNLFMALKK